jgi:hypothetical protein
MNDNVNNLGIDISPKYHMDLDIMTYMHSFELDLMDQDIAQKGMEWNVMTLMFLFNVPFFFIMLISLL